MPTPRANRQPVSEAFALDKLSSLCAASEHCRQDVVDKCAAWGLDSDAANRVADRLVAERFVDDSRYAPLFVRDKARFSGWGPVKVRQQLKIKGINPDTIADAIAAFDSAEWDEILRHALQQKLRTTKKDDPHKLYAALVRFALQRGFEYQTIRHALQDIVASTDNDDF